MSLTLSEKPSAHRATENPAEYEGSDFAGNALRILHRILIRLRWAAFEGTDPNTIGWMLDDIEYIGVLVMESRTNAGPEQIADFRMHLLGLETKYPAFGKLTQIFDTWQSEKGG